jgi:hypothetical protein
MALNNIYLPSSLLTVTLSYVGDANDFVSLSKTSEVFRTLLQDDDSLWSFCKECRPEDYDHPYLNKELALIPLALEEVEKWRKKPSSPTLSVLQEGG